MPRKHAASRGAARPRLLHFQPPAVDLQFERLGIRSPPEKCMSTWPLGR